METQSFLSFSVLPKELRLMIWAKSIPDSRIVHLQKRNLPFYVATRVWSDKHIDEHFSDGVPVFFDAEHQRRFSGIRGIHYGPDGFRFEFRSTCDPPTLLHVCQESRGVALSFYTMTFGTNSSMPHTYFDFKRDFLYLDWDNDSMPTIQPSNFHDSDTLQVRNLATFDHLEVSWSGHYCGEEYDDYEDRICAVLLTFPRLESLITVIGKLYYPNGDPNLVFKSPPSVPGIWPMQYDLPPYPKSNLNIEIKHHHDFILQRKAFVDLERLAVHNQWCVDHGIKYLSIPPIIDCQIVTTPVLKVYLEEQERFMLS